MNMLIVSPRFPYPLNKGDRLTVYNYVKFFSKNHSVTLLAIIGSKKEVEYIKYLEPYCKKVEVVYIPVYKSLLRSLVGLVKWKPLQISYYYSTKVDKKIKELTEKNDFHVVYAHTIRTGEYIRYLEHSVKVLAMQISMQLNYERLSKFSNNILKKILFSIEHKVMKSYEPNIIKDFDLNLLISDIDRQAVGGEHADNIFLNPHGVDYKYFTADLNVPKEENSIIFTGNMAYEPNVDAIVFFCSGIYPIIKETIPDVKLYIVGAKPQKRVLQLADGDESITVTGRVEDMREYLNKAMVGIDPLRIGAGLQNKVLEGMSMRLPMVITSIANEGIKAVPVEDVVLADSESEFAKATVNLLKNKSLRDKLGGNARKFIEEKFTWEVHLMDLEIKLTEMVKNSN